MRVYRGQNDTHSGRRQSPSNDRGYNNDRGGRSDRPEMHDAVCDECGKDCQVPFRPSGNKPVYCSKCFENHDNGGRDDNRSRGRRDSFRREERKEMFPAVCDECGKDCEVPFKPSTDKPIYCSDCFETKGGNTPRSGGNNNQMSEKLSELELKVDKILRILETNSVEEVVAEIEEPTVTEETPEIEEVVEKPKKKRKTAAKKEVETVEKDIVVEETPVEEQTEEELPE